MKLEKFGEVIDYVVNDITHHYGLNSEVVIKLYGTGVTELFGKQERMVCVDKLTIWSDTIENKVVLTAHPFTAADKYWNGPNVIPNDDYESMLASLFHDLLYKNLTLMAKQLDCSESEVRKWADKVLYAIWAGASRNMLERLKARVGYSVCRIFGGIFHTLTKWFIFIVAILAIGGCCVPDWSLEVDEGEAQIKEIIDND